MPAGPPAKPEKLWIRYHRASHGRAIIKLAFLLQTESILATGTHSMGTEPTPRKDTLKVEKLSLLVLAFCIAVLVYVIVVRPF